MNKGGKTKGFITIASSVANYQKMARILCQSYKHTTESPLPFAVVTDKKTELLDVFDDVIELPDLSKSANDKFLLLKVSPYDETIYVDSDCIAYNDLNELFICFEASSDVSAVGKKYPKDSTKGWYEKENLGKYKSKVNYIQDLHGGIYFFRKGTVADAVYSTSMDIMKDYRSYHFKGFAKPSDEPVFALAMAANGCSVTERSGKEFAWMRRCENLKADFFRNILSYRIEGMEAKKGLLLHFGTSRTILPLYQIESRKVQYFDIHEKEWNSIINLLVSIKCYVISGYYCLVNMPKIIKKRKGL